MWRILPVLTVVLLLSLSVVVTAQAASMDTWKITIESDVPLSADVEKGIEGAAEYIVREVIPEWEEYALIQCFCRVTEQEGETYRVTMAIDAEHTSGEAVYIKVLFEYDAQSGGYVIKEGEPTPTTTDETPSATSPPSSVSVSLWSTFELSEETEKGIKDAAEQLVKERINVEESGGVAVDCFVLKIDEEWYTTYARVYARPLPLLPESPEASQSEAKAWEAVFKYEPTQRIYEVTSFSQVDNFLVPGDVEQKAKIIGERDEEIKAFVVENAENNLTSWAEWINRDHGIVRLQYTAASTLNDTHALYEELTTYIGVESEEVLHVEKHEGVWYAPGVKGAPEPVEAGKPTTTTDAAASPPAEYYHGLGAMLIAIAVAVAAGMLLAIRKMRR